jgi:hypothetical protein
MKTSRTIRFAFASTALLVAAMLSAESQPIFNDTEWKDTSGEEIRAQGGCIFRAENAWWWYGVDANPGPDGAPVYNAVRCYSSTDLSHWTPHGKVLTEKVPARVQAARTAGGAEWVLFLRDPLPAARAGDRAVRLAAAKSPTGSFEELPPLTVPGSGAMNSFSVFQDDDGTAWFLFACENPKDSKQREVFVAKLSPDLRSAAGAPQRILSVEGEEPRMWKRNGAYFLGTAKTADWVNHSAVYATSPALTGPYGPARFWNSRGQPKHDTNMSTIDGVFEVKGTEGFFLMYYGSRYSQLSTMGVGRNIMVPWGTGPKESTEVLLWFQTWWLDVGKGTWGRKLEDQPGEKR